VLCVALACGCARADGEAPRPPLGAARARLFVDFDRWTEGPYSPARLASDWGAAPSWQDGISQGRAAIETSDGGDGRFLRVRYPKGGVGPKEGGVQFLVPLGRRYQDLYCAYRVRFAAGFDFVKGGKLPGLAGGAHNSGGHKPNGIDGFSARMMWRSGGSLVQYLYHPDQQGDYGEDLPWGRRVSSGRWYVVEHRLAMNTPGQRDGIVQGWLDGQLVLDRRDVRFRDVETLAVDVLFFSTFFGGSDPTWGPGRDEYVDFDDVVVSERPIAHGAAPP
jgi:hypothetical protein